MPAVLRLAEEDGVVPRVARRRAAGSVRPLGHHVRQDRPYVLRRPAGAERQVEGVHAEIAETAVRAVQLRPPLPVDRLLRVEVAGVEKERANLDHATEPALPDEARDLLAAWIEGELRRAPREQVRPGGDLAVDRLVRRQVDPERLLAE